MEQQKQEKKSRVMVVGGTGYLGRRIVRECLKQAHPTYILFRPNIGLDIEKLQMLLSFKMEGAHLVECTLDNKEALVTALRKVDVVICAMAGNHIRSHAILEQLKLVDAIKEAGNIKRFLPSEFGMDPDRMENAMEPGNVTFIDKRTVRRAIEEAGIPYTYLPAGCFAGYFVGGLAQMGTLTPPKDQVVLYGNGDIKSVWVDEDDIAAYAVRTVDDPRAQNKTVHIRPKDNILSQRQVVETWEMLSGKQLKKVCLSNDDFLALMKGREYVEQVGMTHFYHIFYEGAFCNFSVGDRDEEEASELYPDVDYTKVDTYLERFL